MKRITDAKIRSLKPKKKNYRENVAERLFIEVRRNGKKFWRYRYKKAMVSIQFNFDFIKI